MSLNKSKANAYLTELQKMKTKTGVKLSMRQVKFRISYMLTYSETLQSEVTRDTCQGKLVLAMIRYETKLIEKSVASVQQILKAATTVNSNVVGVERQIADWRRATETGFQLAVIDKLDTIILTTTSNKELLTSTQTLTQTGVDMATSNEKLLASAETLTQTGFDLATRNAGLLESTKTLIQTGIDMATSNEKFLAGIQAEEPCVDSDDNDNEQSEPKRSRPRLQHRAFTSKQLFEQAAMAKAEIDEWKHQVFTLKECAAGKKARHAERAAERTATRRQTRVSVV